MNLLQGKEENKENMMIDLNINNVDNKRFTTTTIVFNVPYNKSRLLLPRNLQNICGFQVRSITWRVTPPLLLNAIQLWISSDELIRGSVNQSLILVDQLASVVSSNQSTISRSIIASYLINSNPNIPNHALPNINQNIRWMKNKMNIRTISFLIESDNSNNVYFDPDNNVIITIDFFNELCD
jgi:hypothetical protein